ncbi:MAG: DDE-type integrase/transposase/recombinase [Helicobacteraceae bacterium]|nr:DDE-type integrase/transposase/recombinase [Helicobacteraceae bacterium]
MNTYLNATPEQRAIAILHYEVVHGYEKRKNLSIRSYIDMLDERFDELKVNETKIYRWKRKVDEALKVGTNKIEALFDSRGAVKGKTKLTQEMQDMVVRMAFRRDNPLTAKAIHLNMSHRYGELMVSYDVLNNFLKVYKKTNYMLTKFAADADGFKNSLMAAFGSLSEKAKYANHYWELDSTPADLITSDGKRYAILCAIDVYSRRAVYWVDEKSDKYSIARLLRKAIKRLGVPEHVVIDNGKDYQSNHFDSICYNLGIEKVTVPPFSGDMKPHVERVFRTLSSELFEQLDGYIGHSVAEREKIQSRRGFQHKLESQQKWSEELKTKAKKEFVKAFRLTQSNTALELHTSLSARELEKWVDGWNEEIYERRRHGSLECSPMTQWHKSLMTPTSIADERMLDILLGESYIRKVGKKGIRLDGALYQHVNLAYHVGSSVRVMTTDDMGIIFVYEIDYKPVCIAEDYEFSGKSREKLATGKKISKKIMREMNKLLGEWEAYSKEYDPSITDIIEHSRVAHEMEVKLPELRVQKQSEVIAAVQSASATFAEQDNEAAESSNITHISGEKLLPSGRPPFKELRERFIWDLMNDRVDEQTEKLAKAKPQVWEIAQREYERLKVG